MGRGSMSLLVQGVAWMGGGPMSLLVQGVCMGVWYRCTFVWFDRLSGVTTVVQEYLYVGPSWHGSAG